MNFETWFDPSYARRNFVPLTNETLALGSSSVRWVNIYSKTFNVSDGTRLGVLQANANGIEIGSTSNHHLRFLVGNALQASFPYGTSDPTLRFASNGVICNTDNTQILSIGAGSAALNTSGGHIIFISNSYGTNNGGLFLGSGNASGANIEVSVWSSNGSFKCYVNSASNLAVQILSTKVFEFYGITDFKATMGDSTKTVGTDAPADWVEVKIGGTTRYLPAYAA